MTTPATPTGFVVVRYPPGGGYNNTPTVIHATEEAARSEAERLCRKSGQRFVVFQAVAHVSPLSPPIEWTLGAPAVGDENDLPF